MLIRSRSAISVKNFRAKGVHLPLQLGRRRGARGFTLIELLTVIAVVGILLGISVIAISPSGGPRARRAARDEVVAMLTRARSEAIASGNPTAVAIVGFGAGPDGARGKALTTYAVRREGTGEAISPVEQKRRWVKLPGRTILLGAASGAGDPTRASNLIDGAAVLKVRVPPDRGTRATEVMAPCVVFESTGAVSHPPGSGRLALYIGEGTWRNNELVVTARKNSGEPVADAVFLSRLTGRARSMEGGS